MGPKNCGCKQPCDCGEETLPDQCTYSDEANCDGPNEDAEEGSNEARRPGCPARSVGPAHSQISDNQFLDNATKATAYSEKR